MDDSLKKGEKMDFPVIFESPAESDFGRPLGLHLISFSTDGTW